MPMTEVCILCFFLLPIIYLAVSRVTVQFGQFIATPFTNTGIYFYSLYIAHYLYETEEACVDRLKQFAEAPEQIPMPLDVAFSQIDWTYCRDDYRQLFASKQSSTSSELVNNHSNSNHIEQIDDVRQN